MFFLQQSFPQQDSSLSGRAPKAKAKAKARGRGVSGVTEERPANEDELRALLSLLAKKESLFYLDAVCMHWVCSRTIGNQSISMLPTHPHTGSTLKKEMTACNTIALDLPKGHNLRKSLLQYKQRFEDAVDELLDCISTYGCAKSHFAFINYIITANLDVKI